MRVVHRLYPVVLIISILAFSGLFIPHGESSAATGRTLVWKVVDTPSDGSNGMFIRTCGINDFALGPDNKTFYAVSTDNSTPGAAGLFKSTDAGYTWSSNIGNSLAAAAPPALFPVWHIAVAPDDANFIVAVTDNSSTSASGGPRMAYNSIDGGSNWTMVLDASTTLNPNEYVRDIDISPGYGGRRDIGIVTANGTGGGRWLVRSSSSFSTWADQSIAPSVIPPWAGLVDYYTIRFSPNYNGDSTVALVYATAATGAAGTGTFYNVAIRDTNLNTTTGYASAGSGVEVVSSVSANSGNSPAIAQLRNVCLQLPAGFSGQDPLLREAYISLNSAIHNPAAGANGNSGVYRIDDTIQYVLMDTTSTANKSIYSIAFSDDSGTLLAGEVAATSAATAKARVWRCNDAQSTAGDPGWILSDSLKSPTGGSGTGLANVLLGWSTDGQAYCGTSSENTIVGGTGTAPGQWPFSKLNKVLSDESSFQYSTDGGYAWNQIGIINTIINSLSDVAAVEEQDEESNGAGKLYLASLNDNATVIPGIDSMWRSTSNPMGLRWERAFTFPSSNNGAILRLPPPEPVSSVVVLADTGTTLIYYSDDSGDTWSSVLSGATVKDISLASEGTLYVLDDYDVLKITGSSTAWKIDKRLNTNMLVPAHTLCNPIEASGRELVFVGSEGNTDTSVAWVDFSQTMPEFTVLKELPIQGNVHVTADDRYEDYANIYAAVSDINNEGIIYRWTMMSGTGRGAMQASTDWDPLDPPDRGFYGICMLNDVLYGAWNTDIEPPTYSSGADRTLEARVKVPPAPWWDQLIAGLPLPGSPNQVEFTNEPTSLHISSNSYNTLWAIDNQDYSFTANAGCLWQFIDSVAKLGPWPTAPAPGSFIGADPVTGRSQQVDFMWRPLKDIFGYDLLIAKDVNFTLLLSQNLQMTPVDNVTGAWVVIPADQEDPACWLAPGVLEAGRTYYWKVRGSRTISENISIHSPWSPTMFFSVRPGFMVTSDYMGPTLLAPVDGVCSNCRPPIRFSWSPIKNAKVYEFILAKDAQLKDVIILDWTGTTAFEVRSGLPLSTPLFWRVKAISPVISDPSPIGTFTLTENITQPQKLPDVLPKPGAVPDVPALPDFWIWIVIGVVVAVALIVGVYTYVSRRKY